VSPTFEIEACRSDETCVPLEARARFLKEQGQRMGLVCVLRDITHEKALEQQRTEFLSMLTHDIRNPIGVISGYTELLIETAQARHDQVEEDILRRIHGNTLTVCSLVSNYLDYSKIEAGRLTLAKQRLDLNDILRRVVRQYETEAQRQGLTLAVHLSESLPMFEADPLGLERIFTNLLHNAIKFSLAGGCITICSEWHHGTLLASVADTGPGIEPQELPQLFHKYHRATQMRAKEGSGLGLFIAKTLTEAHGGQISATSTVGQGTIFTVQLPVQNTPPQLEKQPNARL
jgi:two-component system sensor histidine kinase ResE